MNDNPAIAGLISAFEVRITRVHVRPSLLMEGHEHRIDAARWQPLIMNFQKLYGVSGTEIVTSRLAEIDESCYRMPDVDRARVELVGSRLPRLHASGRKRACKRRVLWCGRGKPVRHH